jgi:hypothetical protein
MAKKISSRKPAPVVAPAPVAPTVPVDVEPLLKCRQCGSTHVGAEPKTPSVNCLIAARNALEVKPRRSVPEEKILMVVKLLIQELNDKGPFPFCPKCQESLAKLLGNPDRLWIDLGFAKTRWEEIHAEQRAEAAKKREEAQAEQERRLQQAADARRRQEEEVAAQADDFLSSFETPDVRAQREAEEKAHADADARADEWLTKLVRGVGVKPDSDGYRRVPISEVDNYVLASEVGYIGLVNIDPRNDVLTDSVPGSTVKGTALDVNDKGKPVMYNISVPVIATQTQGEHVGEPFVKDGKCPLTKPRVVILSGPHAHRAREISIEMYGEEGALPYYAVCRTIERFQSRATVGRRTYKLGEVAGFPKPKPDSDEEASKGKPDAADDPEAACAAASPADPAKIDLK